MLDREEYIEQAYCFGVLLQRMRENIPIQQLLATVREEVLSTTKLPMAIDYLLSELRHSGIMSSAMSALSHYFSAFQTYIITEAEREGGRFDMWVGLDVLRQEAAYRAEGCTPQGIFLYQFETLCRNRLRYDKGLEAMAADPSFDEGWQQWILTVRQQIGLIDIADMIYVRSQHYQSRQASRAGKAPEPERPVLFGEKEGKIALANRQKDPLLLLAALQRQLGYPQVPRPRPQDQAGEMVPLLVRQVERLETRIKLLEEEQRGGIDLNKSYGPEPD